MKGRIHSMLSSCESAVPLQPYGTERITAAIVDCFIGGARSQRYNFCDSRDPGKELNENDGGG